MDEALIKRVLPHSVEAEQSVIGSMLMDREAIIAASEIITGADFYQHQYGVMFESMVELFNEGKPVDLVTLQNRLREKDVPPEVSSLDFVRDIMTSVPTSVNVKSYANIVREKAVLRRLIKVNEEIENLCYGGRDKLEDILAHTEKSVFDLLQSRGGGEFVPIRQVALNVLEKIEAASKSNSTVTGIPTGFIDLDYRTSGFQPSDFILIAARPSMGKTAFVLNVVEHVAVKKGLPCMVFSLEMSKEQLVNRMLSMESNVDSQKLRTGTQLLGIDIRLHRQHTVDQLFLRHFQAEYHARKPFFDRHMLDDIQNKRRLTHRRTRRNQNKIGRLESRRPVIQIDKSGRNTRDGAVALRRRLNLFQNIQRHLADRHKLSASAALKQVKHRFLRVRQNILQLVPSAVTEVFNLLIHFYQTAQDCLFPHDIGIRFDIDRGRHRCHDIPDKVQAADLRRNIFFA